MHLTHALGQFRLAFGIENGRHEIAARLCALFYFLLLIFRKTNAPMMKGTSAMPIIVFASIADLLPSFSAGNRQ